MATFSSFWATLTETQATLLAAVLTILAAITGVSLGSWLFGGRVRDLQSALDRSDQMLRSHQSTVDETLRRIRDQIGSLDEQVRSVLETISQVQGSVADIRSSSPDEGVTEPEAATREGLRDQWDAIRDKLEAIAASDTIDGRTRAKYGRIDRRRYNDLVDALAWDGRLGRDEASYRNAVAIWQKYRNGRKTPSAADAAMMEQLHKELVGS